MANMASSQHNGAYSDSDQIGPWQERLQDICERYGMGSPVYHVASDRRGGRTAWSCAVEVNGQTYNAIYWYDGHWVGNAKEDSAQVAVTKITEALETLYQHQQQQQQQQQQQGGNTQQ